MRIELTKDQADQLLQLLDVAIKAGGYQNAKYAVPIIELILKSSNESDLQ